MRNIILFALVVALTTTISSVVHAAPENTPQVAAQLRVRVYDMTMVPAADQTVALRAATGVLAAAGIDTSWVSCGAGSAAAGCETPVAANELSVRLVRLPAEPNEHGLLQLGYSLVNTQTREGTLATMFVDRVEWLATRAGAHFPTVLGFAIAHEIGHLLLGTNAHAGHGLMRAVWSRNELQHARKGDWVFLPAESLRMRTALTEREGLKFSQHNTDAGSCSAPDDGAAGRAAAGCRSTAAAASLRGVAAGGDR